MDIADSISGKKAEQSHHEKKMGHQGGSKRRGEYRIVTLFFVLA